jgi:hypothetical protein
MTRRLRLAGLAAHAAYVAALVWSAVAVYRYGHRPPTGPGADWAYFDALFSTAMSIAIVGFAIVHVLAALAWFGDPRYRWTLATTLPVAALVGLVWLAVGFETLPGWTVVVTALLAAAASAIVPLLESRVGASSQRGRIA